MAVPERSYAPTPGQTVGPFFAYGLEFPGMHEVAFPHSPGALVLDGRLSDGAGHPVSDAVIEIWSADEDGVVRRGPGPFHRDGHTFTGFGRAFTDDDGHFEFWTRNPGVVEGKAAFFAAIVYARGLPDKLHTRIYLPDDAEALAADPVLSSLDADERATLVATRTPGGGLRHDIRLQGENETVFLVF
jgi:protocatechuate 3,4-dioxygenase alpha subunit